MRAVVGSDEKLWKRLPSFITPGTPLYTENGGDILKGPRNYDAAKKLLAEAGYKGTACDLSCGSGQSIRQTHG